MAFDKQMSKLDYLQHKKLNPADELREILRSLEERQLSIKTMDAAAAQRLLRDFDQITELFAQLEAVGLDLLPERGRFEAVEARLKNVAGPFLKALGGPAQLAKYRPVPVPPREHWWWYLHEIVVVRQQQFWRQMGITGVVILLILGGLILAFKTVLAPSPETLARVEAQNNALAAVEASNYREALTFIEQGLVKVPGDPGLLIFKGVLHEQLGQEAEASRSFAEAQRILGDPLNFYLSRSQLELGLNQLAKAETDARTALELDENSAKAWLLLGQALELQDKRFAAMTAYEKAGDLALANGEDEVVVIARMALGRIGAMP